VGTAAVAMIADKLRQVDSRLIEVAEVFGNQRVKRNSQNLLNCIVAQNYAVPVSEFVRKRLASDNRN
jgi:hypothetical protein